MIKHSPGKQFSVILAEQSSNNNHRFELCWVNNLSPITGLATDNANTQQQEVGFLWAPDKTRSAHRAPGLSPAHGDTSDLPLCVGCKLSYLNLRGETHTVLMCEHSVMLLNHCPTTNQFFHPSCSCKNKLFKGCLRIPAFYFTFCFIKVTFFPTVCS